MDEQNKNLVGLIHSKDNEQVTQGLLLLDALKLPREERTKILDFSNQSLTLTLDSVNLSDADFSNAVIKGSLSSCNLSRATFKGAWVAVAINDETCDISEIDCTGAIFTDETGFSEKSELPLNVQSQVLALYPVQKLSRAVQNLNKAVREMGGSWEPSYTDEFLTNPHKIKAYVDSLSIGSEPFSLSKRFNSRKLDYYISGLPSFLRDGDVYLSGSFDDEGGYYFDNLCLGPSWTKKHSAYYSENLSFFVITYEYFYLNFKWSELQGEDDETIDEFLNWLSSRCEELPIPVLDNQEIVKKVKDWTEEEKINFEAFFVENWEIGHCDDLYNLREVVSAAYPNYIGGEFVWTSWDTIKNNIQ